LGNAVLEVDLYDGNSRGIQIGLLESYRNEQNEPVKADEVDMNGFKFAEVAFSGKNYVLKRQFYRRGSRLYVFTGASRDPRSSLVKDLFDSIVLVNGQTAVTPNMDPKPVRTESAKMVVPESFIVRPLTIDDKVIEEKDADRRAVIIFQPAPQFPPVDSRFQRTFNQIAVRVLLKADGTIGETTLETKTAQALEKEALNAAKGIQFLAAEKDGKPVSTYRTVEFAMSIN
jgi:hypothetical protein